MLVLQTVVKSLHPKRWRKNPKPVGKMVRIPFRRAHYSAFYVLWIRNIDRSNRENIFPTRQWFNGGKGWFGVVLSPSSSLRVRLSSRSVAHAINKKSHRVIVFRKCETDSEDLRYKGMYKMYHTHNLLQRCD